MNFGKKFDRAFQWAGEKMGSEARTNMSDDFKTLETEMALRFDGMNPYYGPSRDQSPVNMPYITDLTSSLTVDVRQQGW